VNLAAGLAECLHLRPGRVDAVEPLEALHEGGADDGGDTGRADLGDRADALAETGRGPCGRVKFALGLRGVGEDRYPYGLGGHGLDSFLSLRGVDGRYECVALGEGEAEVHGRRLARGDAPVSHTPRSHRGASLSFPCSVTGSSGSTSTSSALNAARISPSVMPSAAALASASFNPSRRLATNTRARKKAV